MVLRGPGVMRANAHRAWLLVPIVWQVGLAPLVNGVAVQPFGLPFPMVWQMLGIALASVCIAVVYRIDRRRGRPDGSA